MMGISIWQLAIILIIVALLFGTKRLRSLGGDVGGAISGFRQAMQDNDAPSSHSSTAAAEKQQQL